MVRFGVVAVCLAACGSPDANALTQSGTRGSTGGSAISPGGAPPLGMGGTPYAAGGTSMGGFQSGAGGIPTVGGFTGAGAFSTGTGGYIFGSGGATFDSGMPIGAGGGVAGSGGATAGTGGGTGTAANPFPPGGLITQACSDCARLQCRAEEDACAADPSCLAIGQCLSTCFGPTCLACLPTLTNQAGYTLFTAVSNCTDLSCQPTCPLLNSGGGTNP